MSIYFDMQNLFFDDIFWVIRHTNHVLFLHFQSVFKKFLLHLSRLYIVSHSQAFHQVLHHGNFYLFLQSHYQAFLRLPLSF